MRGTFVLLILCVFATRMLVPPGFMPTQGVSGFVVTLCTGFGPVRTTMLLPMEKQEAGHEDHKPASHETPCAYATNGTPFDQSVGFALAKAPLRYALSLGSPFISIGAPGRGMAAPPPPSQAPPSAMN
ncbi:hypothetical protein [Sphingomonas sp. SRS2]|nr:hypothetical protein [Sphingomonas sp. SRS2]